MELNHNELKLFVLDYVRTGVMEQPLKDLCHKCQRERIIACDDEIIDWVLSAGKFELLKSKIQGEAKASPC